MEKLNCLACRRVCYHSTVDFYNQPINTLDDQIAPRCLSCGTKWTKNGDWSTKVLGKVITHHAIPENTNVIRFTPRNTGRGLHCP